MGRKRLVTSRLGESRLAWSEVTTVTTTGGTHVASGGKATTTRGIVTKAWLAAIPFTVTARRKTTVFATTAKSTGRRPAVIAGTSLHTLAVAGAVCVLSLGLVYVGYLVHVLRVARNAPCVPVGGECVLVFGKHAPQPDGGISSGDLGVAR